MGFLQRSGHSMRIQSIRSTKPTMRLQVFFKSRVFYFNAMQLWFRHPEKRYAAPSSMLLFKATQPIVSAKICQSNFYSKFAANATSKMTTWSGVNRSLLWHKDRPFHNRPSASIYVVTESSNFCRKSGTITQYIEMKPEAVCERWLAPVTYE